MLMGTTVDANATGAQQTGDSVTGAESSQKRTQAQRPPAHRNIDRATYAQRSSRRGPIPASSRPRRTDDRRRPPGSTPRWWTPLLSVSSASPSKAQSGQYSTNAEPIRLTQFDVKIVTKTHLPNRALPLRRAEFGVGVVPVASRGRHTHLPIERGQLWFDMPAENKQ